MHLCSLRDVYPLISDVTPRTIFVEGSYREYRRFFSLVREEVVMTADEMTPRLLREIARDLGFEELLSKVNSAIAKIGGRAFVRWDNHYPKDACLAMHERLGLEVVPGTCENACIVRSAEEFFVLSLNSMRTLMFVKDYGAHSLYPIAVREPIDVAHEYRIVVRRGRVVAVLQYYYAEHYGLELDDATELARNLARFATEVAKRFPCTDLVLDVGISEGKPIVIETAPPPHLANVALPGIDDVGVSELYGRDEPLFTYRTKDGKLLRLTLRL